MTLTLNEVNINFCLKLKTIYYSNSLTFLAHFVTFAINQRWIPSWTSVLNEFYSNAHFFVEELKVFFFKFLKKNRSAISYKKIEFGRFFEKFVWFYEKLEICNTIINNW